MSPDCRPSIINATPAGYSGTPLPKKLGVKEGHRVGLLNAPDGFETTLGELPYAVELADAARGKSFDVMLLFAGNTAALVKGLPRMISKMEASTSLWICWPKRTSPLASDVGEADVRRSGLAAGIVDVKICAIDEDWSGLKFMYRLADRPKLATTTGRKKK